METKLKEFLEKCPPVWRTRNIQKYPEYVTLLDSIYPGIKLNIQIDCFLSGRTPYCSVCNHPIKFSGKLTCSTKCRSVALAPKQAARVNKQKLTLQQKYGVTNIRNIAGVELKRKETMQRKYGGLVSDLTRQKAKDRSNELNAKGRITINNKYGVKNVSQLSSVKEKKKQQSLEKYGCSNISQRHLTPEMINIFHNKELLSELLTGKSIREVATLLGYDVTAVYNQCKSFDIGNIRSSSSYETEIDNWLKQYPITYIRNTKKIISPLELDFFFPGVNVAIEFNGLAHHSEFLGSQLRKNKTTFKDYHFQKWKLCSDKGIMLLSIFEDEWNNKKDVIKRTILRLLKINPSKSIGARKVSIKETTNKSNAINFLDNNHWQGSIRNFQIGYEAYYNNSLIGVMTFNKTKQNYLLTRYCVGEGNFPGLFAKILNAFINKYDPNKIVTFSDNRYATGNIYQTNGFLCLAELQAGYAITNYVNRWHRSNFQKNLIKKKFDIDIANKTELQLLRELKFDRIWDCGKKRWVWAKEQGPCSFMLNVVATLQTSFYCTRIL